MVIPLKEKGVTRKRMHNSGVNASGKETCILERVPLDLTIAQALPSLNLMMFVFQPIILSEKKTRVSKSSCRVSTLQPVLN